MKTFTLPGTDMVVPNIVLGLMRIQDMNDDEVRTLGTRHATPASPSSTTRTCTARAATAASAGSPRP